MGRREHGILGSVVVVPGERRHRAMALSAVAGDSRVQDRIRRQGRRRVVARRRGVTLGAGEAARIRHMAGRQCGAVPVRRRVADAAVVRRQHLTRVVIGGSALQRGARRPHVEREPRLVASVAAGGHEGVLGLCHVHRPEGADRIGARGVTGAAVGAGQVRDMSRREQRILGREVVVPGERRDGVAMAEPAIARDAGVQDRVRRQSRWGVVAWCRGVTLSAGEVAGIRHVSRGQRGAVPAGRGVAEAAVVRRHHVARGVIGRPSLQSRSRGAQVETQTRLVAGIAGSRHERMLGRAHVGGTESAGDIGRCMAGTAVGARQVRDMRGREHRILGRVVVGPGQGRCGVAVADPAIAADARVQRGESRQRGRCVVARRRGVALNTGQVGRIRHVTRRQGIADPVLGRVTHRAVAAGHGRVGTADVIRRPQLQRRTATDVETLARVVAGIAARGHEGMRGRAHGRRRTKAAGLVGSAVTGAAIGAREDRNVRRRERRQLGGRHAGNRHRDVGRGHACESLPGVAQQAVVHRQPGVQRRNARGQRGPGLRCRVVAVADAAIDARGNRRHVIRRLPGDKARGDLDAAAVTGLAGLYRHLGVIK